MKTRLLVLASCCLGLTFGVSCAVQEKSDDVSEFRDGDMCDGVGKSRQGHQTVVLVAVLVVVLVVLLFVFGVVVVVLFILSVVELPSSLSSSSSSSSLSELDSFSVSSEEVSEEAEAE